jgi:1-deoxypentalenic acid 11beta-hydroxylase
MLDPANLQLSSLREADAHHPPAELNRLYDRDGYLFFRNAIDNELILKAAREFILELQRQGVVRDGGEDQAIWTGATLDQIDEDRLYELTAYRRLLDAVSVNSLFETVFGQPVLIFRSVNIRYALPHDDLHASPPHQDRFFVGPNDDFRTAWLPLVNIPEEVGGLALATGSHRGAVINHVPVAAESYVFRGRKQLGIAASSIAPDWLTASYQIGDVLLFHNRMIHGALPNRSNVVRLSLDVRVQPASTPASWQARNTIPEMRSYRAHVRELVTDEGGTETEFEAVLREMMMAGSECPDNIVPTLLAEVRSQNIAT